MAETVDAFPHEPRTGYRRLYPWERWLDGRIWRLEHGVDFKSTAAKFQIAAWRAAKDRGLKLTTQRNGDVVHIQAHCQEALATLVMRGAS
jgi:hypothetical protein